MYNDENDKTMKTTVFTPIVLNDTNETHRFRRGENDGIKPVVLSFCR
jgi:hypothetical protein